MASTDIEFGPDWLKSIQSKPSNSSVFSGEQITSNNSNEAKPPKFKPHLAKNRYGREDMLALYQAIVDAETGILERLDIPEMEPIEKNICKGG